MIGKPCSSRFIGARSRGMLFFVFPANQEIMTGTRTEDQKCPRAFHLFNFKIFMQIYRALLWARTGPKLRKFQQFQMTDASGSGSGDATMVDVKARL